MKKQNSEKLTLTKTSLLNLTVRTGIEAGACSKNWSYRPSNGPDGCGSTRD
jgi:hypothetical protein